MGERLVASERIWIIGTTRSGKTTHLIRQFCAWLQIEADSAFAVATAPSPPARATTAKYSTLTPPGVLVFAAIGDNRLDLSDRLTIATHGNYPVYSTTPLGFFQDEVALFYPLLVQQLGVSAQFPLRLNPENEQELATQLWQPELDSIISQQPAINSDRLVRRILDLLQLAALAGIPIEDLPTVLQQGLAGQESELPLPFEQLTELLHRWQQWCLERGLLSYGLIAGLYWQYLLPNPTYQMHLAQRYQILLADDVDEYPAIARNLFEVLINQGVHAAFTFNPDGAVRLGLGADPAYLAELADQCQVERLAERPVPALETEWGDAIAEFVMNPLAFWVPPESVRTIQTSSRAELLRRTAEVIIEAIQTRQVEPSEIAVIGPGLDAIARYTFIDILTKNNIPIASLNDQRPLNSFPVIRALLTLLALVYPGAGRLVDRDAIAEMLVILSQKQIINPPSTTDSDSQFPVSSPFSTSLIDPVRAGLLADYCFAPHPEHPRLLPPTTFPRWDRLGYQASDAYQSVIQWIAKQQAQLEQRLIPNPVALCDRAIQHFFLGGGTLPYNQLAAIRQLIETAQHYWEVNNRLRKGQRSDPPASVTLTRFIQLLRTGTITANPYPVRPIGPESNAVTLATVFQYRSNRGVHRWQFWLDAGSPRWLSGVDSLFAAHLFLHDWSGRTWTGADALTANEQRLRRILLDLLGRVGERVYLCHSDLATSGQEQTGVLLPLVNLATPLG
ncbi:MAG: recombinase family protein [Oscillatoriales cyanobacterium C42_A2020_001]|nr:recombinase family protein [Leptolyngbyaceae cyanobacterium C42_A2020_001]